MRLVAATDVDNPLLGLHGASAVYGPQKGADQGAVMSLDIGLERWADIVESATGQPGLRDRPGAGAAGGLGFGLLALGAERRSGIDLVMAAVGLRERVEGADLVVTGEGRYDATSLRGKVVAGVARVGSGGRRAVRRGGRSGQRGCPRGRGERDRRGVVGGGRARLDRRRRWRPAAGGVRRLGHDVARSWSR